jgi:hypothetical protein
VKRVPFCLAHVAGLALAFLLDGWNGVVTVAICYPAIRWASGRLDVSSRRVDRRLPQDGARGG